MIPGRGEFSERNAVRNSGPYGAEDEALLLDQLDPDRARGLARELASLLCAENDNSDEDATTLSLLLSDASPGQWRRRIAEAWAVDEEWAGLILTAPWPCRLTTQELVELLKMPTCFGGVRRVVLEHLGNRYGRKFANHGKFVRFAESRRLGLDFKAPPRRPRPAAVAR